MRTARLTLRLMLAGLLAGSPLAGRAAVLRIAAPVKSGPAAITIVPAGSAGVSRLAAPTLSPVSTLPSLPAVKTGAADASPSAWIGAPSAVAAAPITGPASARIAPAAAAPGVASRNPAAAIGKTRTSPRRKTGAESSASDQVGRSPAETVRGAGKSLKSARGRGRPGTFLSRIFDGGSAQNALGTPGVYTKGFHSRRTNPRIRGDIEAGRYVRLEVSADGLRVAEAGNAVSPETLEAVRSRAESVGAVAGLAGSSIYLVEAAPGSPEARHPRLLVVTDRDYQLAHAGTRRDAKGRPRTSGAYLTAGLFIDAEIPDSLIREVLEEELGHAEARLRARTDGRKPAGERFGDRQIETLSKLLPHIRKDFAGGRASDEALPADSGPATRFRAFLAKAWARIKGAAAPGMPKILFDSGAPGHFYHGTSWQDVVKIVKGGGSLKARLSYLSDVGGISYGYARGRGARTGSRGALLQFPEEAVRPKVHVTGAPMQGDRRPIGLYYQALEDIPLSDLTPAAKATLLRELLVRRISAPEDRSWDELLSEFEAALDASYSYTPAARPVYETPVEVPSAPAAEPRGTSILSWIGSFLGPSHRVTDAPDADKAWQSLSPGIDAEIAHLRSLGKDGAEAYLRETGSKIVDRMKARFGSENIGFHYNLHGGQAEQYVQGGGIRATMGDIALNYGSGDMAYKVYFFQSKHADLYDVLNERNPNLVTSRMGTVLMAFPADSPYLKRAFQEGGASKMTAISIDFDPEWIKKNNKGRMIGIPADTFLSPPLEVFMGVKGKIGHRGRLSRDEETLAVMRYIEAAILDVPRD